jgi:hypothetical protein
MLQTFFILKPIHKYQHSISEYLPEDGLVGQKHVAIKGGHFKIKKRL